MTPRRPAAVSSPDPLLTFRGAVRALAALALLAFAGGAAGKAEAAAPAPAPATSAAPALALAPCQLPGLAAPARCGSLEVWEDRDAQRGRRISLRVAVLPARGTPRAPDPIFVIVGGPGQAAIPTAAAFAGIFAEALATRDLVLVDQRGTGESHPLDCRLPGDDADPQSYFGDMFPVAALRACRERLAGYADPALYTTPIAMDDLDDVRAALGYDRVDLYGGSYGSRAALVYMRRHPEHVRSAILRGPVPTGMRTPLYYARDSQHALDQLFAQCRADPACHAAYPDLERQWREVEERLAQGPVEVTLEMPVVPAVAGDHAGQAEHAEHAGHAGPPPSGREAAAHGDSAPAAPAVARLALTRDEFNEAIRYRLYNEESNQIPRFIARAHAGDFADTARLALRQRRSAARGGPISVGLYLSVTCSEDVPFIDPAEARRAAAGTFLGTYRVDQQVKACSAWPRGKLPPGYLDDVTSAAPTLVISGIRDPVAPPVWGEQVARHLSQATHLVLAQGFHGLPGPCISRVMSEFVIRGGAKGLDTSCVQEMRVPPFVLPDGKTAAAPSTPEAVKATVASRTAPATAAAGATPTAEGLWEGTLLYKRAELEVDVTVELARDAQGKWVGTIDLPNQSMKFFPLTAIRNDGLDVEWHFDRFAQRAGVMVETPFIGKLSADGATMTGDFFEGGKNHVPLELHRVGEAGSPRAADWTAPVAHLSDSGEELRALFNRDAGKVRLVMLLSPT